MWVFWVRQTEVYVTHFNASLFIQEVPMLVLASVVFLLLVLVTAGVLIMMSECCNRSL